MTVDHVLTLADACEADDGVAPLDEATILGLERDGLPDSAVVDEHGAAWLTPAAGGSGAELHLMVQPPSRGHGHGARLAEQQLTAYDGEVRAWSHGDHPAAEALAQRFDFAVVRDLWVMRRDDKRLPPLDSVRKPEIVRLRTFDADSDDDRDALLEVNAAAFAHHPEQGSLDVAGFDQRAAEPWFDPEGIFLAEDTTTGQLVGFHWTKTHPGSEGGPPTGEVYVVGVAPGAQGCGLGKLLTLAGLHDLYERHRVCEVLLYVEGDNAAAVATYAGLGFAHAKTDTHVQYLRPAR